MTSPTDDPNAAPQPPRPAMPDLSDLIANPGKPPRQANPRTRMYAAGAVGGVVLLAAGVGIGYAVAPHGPATLTAAVQQAQAGKLPCGTPASGTTLAGGPEAGAGGAGGGNVSTFLVARLCRGAGGGTGATGGTGGGGGGGGFAGGGGGGGGFGGGFRGGLGGLFGPGSVTGTIASLSGNAITLQTRAGTVTITLPASAKVTKTTSGSIKDLSNGEQVIVSSTQDSSGNRTATAIFLLPATTAGQAS